MDDIRKDSLPSGIFSIQRPNLCNNAVLFHVRWPTRHVGCWDGFASLTFPVCSSFWVPSSWSRTIIHAIECLWRFWRIVFIKFDNWLTQSVSLTIFSSKLCQFLMMSHTQLICATWPSQPVFQSPCQQTFVQAVALLTVLHKKRCFSYEVARKKARETRACSSAVQQ